MRKNNIYLDLCSIIKLNTKVDKYEVLKKIETQHTILLSFINVLETFKFENVAGRDERLLFFADHINKSGNIFDEPKMLLGRTYQGFFDGKKDCNFGMESDISEFLENPDLVSKEILNKQNIEDQKQHDTFIKMSQDMRNDIRTQNLMNNENIKYDYNDFLKLIFENDEFLLLVFKAFLDLYNINIYISQINKIKTELTPWIYFWLAHFIAIYNLSFSRQKPNLDKHPGVRDLNQVLYIDACNIFVTEDKRFRKLIIDLLNSDFAPKCAKEKKVMGLDELISSL